MTATVNLAPLAKLRFVDNNGVPLAGGKVFTYASGTTTKQASYSDSTGTTPNANPVILDSRGEASIWLDQTLTYKIVLAPATDTDPPTAAFWTQDGIPASNAFAIFLVQLAAATGSTLMGTILSYTGSIARTQAAKNQDIVTILDFSGVDPTGVSDSKTGLQAAFTACTNTGDKRILIWRKGTYTISGQVSVGSNIAVIFEPGVVVNYTGDVSTQLFNIAGQVNVYFVGNGALINGNRAGVTISDSGNQNCFNVYGSDNVLIQDFNISGFALDGIILTGDTGAGGPCTNVRIVGCDVAGSGRNNLSIVHADGVIVQGGRYRLANGTPSGPWAGIDVEPNTGGEYARNILLLGVKTQDNNGAGLQFTPGAMASAAGLTFDVTVVGGRSQGDGLASSGSTGHAAVKFANGGSQTNEVQGQVSLSNFLIENPGAMGVNFKNWDSANSPRVLLDGVLVINPNGNSASTGNPNQCGFVLYCDSTQAVTNMGKVTMRNCKAVDNRVSPKMQRPTYVGADSTKTVTDAKIIDMEGVNYVAAAKSPVTMDFSLAGTYVDVSITYTNPKALSVAGNVAGSDYPGQLVNMTTATAVYTLPLAAKCKGTVFPVQMDQGVAAGSIARTTTDLIKAFGVAGAASVALQPGDAARARSEGGTIYALIGAN